ncbi:zinc-binding dehydrogenase [Pseudonocardia acidicola]|uniref:Zinc-binding dehydrogenase n=1 Tax=Pseudonocardia acidicola TaxID=2724939 RepID=A0ABX1SL85_9PSEU|nr:zinc-binding dehydrogenase [Pseudonocardia acidicola]NMI01269.1 zinc-binding dehydrogenase [Pseudonocardia acidicola]
MAVPRRLARCTLGAWSGRSRRAGRWGQRSGDPAHGPAVDAVLAATGGAGVDVAADFAGPDTIAQAVECLRIGGRAVVCGPGAEPISVLPPTVFIREEL